MKYQELENKVLQWSKDKGILDKGTPYTQAVKTLEECEELLDACAVNNLEEMKDAYGDILVTIINGAHLSGFDLLNCLESAYKEISGRTGKMVDGTFVKD